ncbi:hypothetical protein [Aquamicrobium ahrensii]|uniref:DNA-binding GntR family transcriptional regulator n=1 Tax=Aquamicrobium ahrensii TaxID=469551 RepID=A0ABV2KN05_9HYPH
MIDQIANALRFDIIFRRLRPRERLVEGDLTERFSVGRYVIRSLPSVSVRSMRSL